MASYHSMFTCYIFLYDYIVELVQFFELVLQLCTLLLWPWIGGCPDRATCGKKDNQLSGESIFDYIHIVLHNIRKRNWDTTNVIFGLALGYKSVIIPIFAIAVGIFVSFSFAAMYGIAVAALGMLSTIATGLAIDAYGPISDNAGGIAEMAGMSHRIRERTDALDAAGNTIAATGKV